MFQFTPSQDPFAGQQDQAAQQGDAYGASNEMVERIMAAEYNLAVQRNDGSQATGILARMLGQFLANRFGR